MQADTATLPVQICERNCNSMTTGLRCWSMLLLSSLIVCINWWKGRKGRKRDKPRIMSGNFRRKDLHIPHRTISSLTKRFYKTNNNNNFFFFLLLLLSITPTVECVNSFHLSGKRVENANLSSTLVCPIEQVIWPKVKGQKQHWNQLLLEDRWLGGSDKWIVWGNEEEEDKTKSKKHFLVIRFMEMLVLK